MSKKRILLAVGMIIICLGFYSCFSKSIMGEPVTISLSCSEDATFTLLKKLEEVKSTGAKELSFEKGIYHFYSERAFEKFCNISNHNDVLARIAFYIKDFDDLLINGNGSEFIFHGRIIPFLIEDSENITVKNLSVDFAEPFHSESKVVAVDAKKKTFDMSISDEYPYEIRDGELIFLKPYFSHNLGQSIFYDYDRRAIAFQTESYSPITTRSKVTTKFNVDKLNYKYKVDEYDDYIRLFGSQNVNKVEELSPGLVRVYNHEKLLPRIGWVLASKGEKGENRFAPAFKLNNVSNFKAENVDIYHAGGMGFLAENSRDIDLFQFNVKTSGDRMVSTTADATHFVGCRGKISLRSCTFNNMLDDAMNVHGAYQEIMDVIDNRTIGIRVGHFQQLGFQLAFPGDTVGLVRLSDSFHAYHKLTVKSTQQINGRYQLITFNENLPDRVQALDLVENISAYPEVLVEDCNISRNRARGILVSSPTKTVIRNNFFSTEMEALLLPVESSSWYESGNATNVLIEGNVFQDCTTGGMNRGVICFRTDDENENIAFSNIEISNNVFNHFDNLILEVTNVDGLLFKGNTISNSGTFPRQFPKEPVVTIQYSKNVVFEDNIYEGRAKTMIKMLDGSETVNFK